MFYDTLSAYNQKFLLIGILFSILFIVSLFIDLRGKRNQIFLKLTMGFSLLWVAWVWLFLTSWVHNYSLLDEFPMVIWPLIMEPIWSIILTVVSIIILKNAFTKKRMIISLPTAKWERVLVFFFLGISILYPLYYKIWGFAYPIVMFIGTGPFPTFIFSGVILASSLPKVNRWLVFLLMLAILSTLPSLSGGLWENCILIPPFVYIFYKYIITMNRIKRLHNS